METHLICSTGKVIESSTSTSILDADVWLDTTFPHVIYITGTRAREKF